MLRKAAIALVVGLVPATAAHAQGSDRSLLMPGVTYTRQVEFTPHGPVVLHVETSMAKHGLSRNDFSRLFLERSGDLIQSWNGYTLKPHYAMEPFSTRLPL